MGVWFYCDLREYFVSSAACRFWLFLALAVWRHCAIR